MKSNSKAQLNLFEEEKQKLTHGGEYSVGRRKLKRPLSLRKPMHVVLRSERAKGSWSLRAFQNQPQVSRLINKFGKRFHVSVYRYSINSNHVHLVTRAKRREDFQNFMRALCGAMVLAVTKSRKTKRIGRFWDHLAFSRVVEWGNAYRKLIAYVVQNQMEANGLVSYKPRKRRPAPA